MCRYPNNVYLSILGRSYDFPSLAVIITITTMTDVEKQATDHEVVLVEFDGPDDPENPFNWPTWKKMRQLVLMAFNTFIT